MRRTAYDTYHRVVVPMILWTLMTAAAPPSVAAGEGGRLRLDLHDNEVRIEAVAVPLGEVIDAIESQLRIDLEGLQTETQRSIDFRTTASSPEILVKQLLRALGERNYVCEYMEDRLVKVIAFPQAASALISAEANDGFENDKPQWVVEVVEVLKETQAEALGVKPGDIVLKYDGVPINTYDDLVRESTKDTGSRMVQMVLLRDDQERSVYLEGGFIGVRVQHKKVP